MEIETDYWKNLSVTHMCGDFYPDDPYADYPDNAEQVLTKILPDFAAVSFVICVGGMGLSAGLPIYKKETPSINLLDIFTLISSICYFSFHGQINTSKAEYATMPIEDGNGYPGTFVANFRLFRVSVAFAMATTIFYLFGLFTTVVTQLVTIVSKQKEKFMSGRDFGICVAWISAELLYPIFILNGKFNPFRSLTGCSI